MQNLTCPRCERALLSRSFSGERGAIVLDLCHAGCGGVWLDAEDTRHGGTLLEALEGEDPAGALLAAIDRTRPAGCPVCRVTMRRFRWNYNSPIVLDQCPEGHGTWIDGGETAEMRAIAEAEAEPLSPEERARLRARLEMARLEVETRLRRADREGRLPHPIVTALELIWGRFL